MWSASWLVQSWAGGCFKMLTTPMRLKRRGGKGQEKNRDVVNDAKLQGIISNQDAFEKQLFLCAKHTGSWMSVQGTTETGTILAATEFRDFKCDNYNVNPPNLINKWYGCLQKFSDCHTLSCRNWGFVIARHNEIRDEIIHLARQAFYHNCVRREPLIHLGHSISEGEVHHCGSIS